MQVGDATWCKYSRVAGIGYKIVEIILATVSCTSNFCLSGKREARDQVSKAWGILKQVPGARSRRRVIKGRMGRDQETKKDVEDDDVRCSSETRKARLSLCVWSCLSRLSAQGSTGWTSSKVPTMQQGMADGLILK
jgi:hypothetical protein